LASAVLAVRPDEIDRAAVGNERCSVGGQLLHLDRLEARAPVEQVLPGDGVVIGHRIDIFEARAEQHRHAHVDEGPGG
jgi:hypothetical protein